MRNTPSGVTDRPTDPPTGWPADRPVGRPFERDDDQTASTAGAAAAAAAAIEQTKATNRSVIVRSSARELECTSLRDTMNKYDPFPRRSQRF